LATALREYAIRAANATCVNPVASRHRASNRPNATTLEPLDAMIRPSGMFAECRPVPAGAVAQERLLAFLDRQP
jgi:hypothetical protein